MERNLPEYIDEHVEKIAELERDVALSYWNFARTGSKADEDAHAEKRRRWKAFYSDRDAFARVRTYDQDPQTDDPLLIRQLRLLRLRYAAEQLPLDLVDRIVGLEVEAERIVNTFRATVDGKRLTANEVDEILRKSDDPDERRTVWEATKVVGQEVGPTIVRLVGLRNRAARDIGYRDYYSMALELQEIDERALFGILEDLVTKTSEAYFAEKALLDAELVERFGGKITDLLPWHYADPFFQTAPQRKRINLDRFYAEKDLCALTTKFFDGLGLDIRPIIDRSDLLPRSGKDQHAFCIHIDRRTDDVRVLSNNAPTEGWMSTMLHEFGHAVYDQNLGADLPFLLRSAAHQLSTEAIAMFMGRLSKSPDFLTSIAEAPKAAVTRAAREMHEQERLQMLIMVRWVAVMAYFERGLYEDPGRDLDRLWWELVLRFQGVRRPPGRRSGDWAAKIHLATAPVYYHNYILGELMASQLKAALPADQGIVQNRAVGDFLKERIFSRGASLHWDELLRCVTGSRLSPKFFLAEYV